MIIPNVRHVIDKLSNSNFDLYAEKILITPEFDRFRETLENSEVFRETVEAAKEAGGAFIEMNLIYAIIVGASAQEASNERL